MDYDKIKIYGTRVKVDSMEKVAEIETAEKLKMKEKVDKILAYQPTVFINRQLIYNYPEQLMADKVNFLDFFFIISISSIHSLGCYGNRACRF